MSHHQKNNTYCKVYVVCVHSIMLLVFVLLLVVLEVVGAASITDFRCSDGHMDPVFSGASGGLTIDKYVNVYSDIVTDNILCYITASSPLVAYKIQPCLNRECSARYTAWYSNDAINRNTLVFSLQREQVGLQGWRFINIFMRAADFTIFNFYLTVLFPQINQANTVAYIPPTTSSQIDGNFPPYQEYAFIPDIPTPVNQFAVWSSGRMDPVYSTSTQYFRYLGLYHAWTGNFYLDSESTIMSFSMKNTLSIPPYTLNATMFQCTTRECHTFVKQSPQYVLQKDVTPLLTLTGLDATQPLWYFLLRFSYAESIIEHFVTVITYSSTSPFYGPMPVSDIDVSFPLFVAPTTLPPSTAAPTTPPPSTGTPTTQTSTTTATPTTRPPSTSTTTPTTAPPSTSTQTPTTASALSTTTSRPALLNTTSENDAITSTDIAGLSPAVFWSVISVSIFLAAGSGTFLYFAKKYDWLRSLTNNSGHSELADDET